jgi:hypothetical protein
MTTTTPMMYKMFIVYSDRGMRDFSVKARCSNRKRLETMLSSGAHG